ncbi:MAG: Crp/Fnr family transcriptional regulator [Anaerosomatales bacterium]|nr:Crp/Fnr family transcriptional regulator [Anaerosomatales bacterium]GAV31992.1 cAMP-binding proteins - catabolite gene activator and regulatory subunit of cAMP-dependent protein kinases [Coriobacteriaceae bacterium EMTCatB1]
MTVPRTDVVAALRSCRLWRTASPDAVEWLAASARVSDAPRGTVLVTEGEPAERFGVVVAGKVRVCHVQADGRTVVLETVGSGGAFAAVSALAGGRYPATVEAVTPVTVAWIEPESVFSMLDAEPQVLRSLVADLASRVVDLTSVVQTLALDVPERLARYLFQRSLAAGEATPEGLRVPLDMTKTELAASLGTVPETLSRAFARLRDDGVLTVRGSEVVVHDVGALARLGSRYEE